MKTFQFFLEDARKFLALKRKKQIQTQQAVSQNYENKRMAAANKQQRQVQDVEHRQQQEIQSAAQKREHENELKKLKKDIRREVEQEFEERDDK